MSKKSSKTSHVLNLLTNRTGAAPEEMDSQKKKEDGASPDASSETVQPPDAQIEITEPIRVAVTNPIIAQLTREEDLVPRAPVSEPMPAQPEPQKPMGVSDIIRTELERSFEEEMKVSTYVLEEFPEAIQPNESEAPDREEEKLLVSDTPKNNEKEMRETVMADTDYIENSEIKGYANVMEEIVKFNAAVMMESLGVCTCERCKNDVIAMSLNQMPPKYVVTEKGTLFTKASAYESQHSVDILSAITKACIQVKNNPRHDE